MSQSNVIFAAILIAFIAYITGRGELSLYIQLLRGGGQQPAAGAGGGTGSGNSVLDGAQSLLSSNPLGLSSGPGFTSSDISAISNDFAQGSGSSFGL